MKIRKPRPVYQVVLLDILLIGISLVVFAYFHHVRATTGKSENIKVSRPVSRSITSSPAINRNEPNSEMSEMATEPPISVDSFADAVQRRSQEYSETLTTEEVTVARPEPENSSSPVVEATADVLTVNDQEKKEEISVTQTPESSLAQASVMAVTPVAEPDPTLQPSQTITETAFPQIEEAEDEVLFEQVDTPLLQNETRQMQTADNTNVSDQLSENTSETEPESEQDAVGNFSIKFADKFLPEGKIETDEKNGVYSYKSDKLNLTITVERVLCHGKNTNWESTVYVTDFYIKDITQLKCVFARDQYGRGHAESVNVLAKRYGAIAAINGDFYSVRESGVVIRNGLIYRRNPTTFDLCVIYWDGTMETYAPDAWDAEELENKGAYHAWCFGPMLLDKDGNAMSSFNTINEITTPHPRTVLGYFEPGHYCFITVDGRSSSSSGITLTDLSDFIHSLGCRCAYNLDGGGTTVLSYRGKVISKPYNGGRAVPDAILLMDLIEE